MTCLSAVFGKAVSDTVPYRIKSFVCLSDKLGEFTAWKEVYYPAKLVCCCFFFFLTTKLYVRKSCFLLVGWKLKAVIIVNHSNYRGLDLSFLYTNPDYKLLISYV